MYNLGMTTSSAAINYDKALYDVLIIGAGLSGIGAARNLQKYCPSKTFAVLEARDAIGGTWDLFRYPGVRSDSDIFTLGYDFKPWTKYNAIASGAEILDYIKETAAEYDIIRLIHFGHRLVSASWSSLEACWTLCVEFSNKDKNEVRSLQMRTKFLYMCSGYYDYSEGYWPEFKGQDTFTGNLVHPQFWPDNLQISNKHIVVIGSGATAVTLVPALSVDAAHVTLLQRSPSYIIERPSRLKSVQLLQKSLPTKFAYNLTRWKFIIESIFLYQLSRRLPAQTKQNIISMAAKRLGPAVDVKKHFSPNYKPWDQRVCVVPDGDLFDEIKEGRASIETDTIEKFTPSGIVLHSGRAIRADIIVVATGLKMKMMGGASFSVDGQPFSLSDAIAYRGMMLSDLPNCVIAFGYTNASWTLKTDLTAGYVCRLLQFMDKHKFAIAIPRRKGTVKTLPFLSFTSGYVQRAISALPKQGDRRPWQVYQNYLLDLFNIKYGPIADGVMHFGAPGELP